MAVDYTRPDTVFDWPGYGRGLAGPFAVIAVEDWAPPWPRPGVTAFGLAGVYGWNISHHGFLMHPPPAFHYLA